MAFSIPAQEGRTAILNSSRWRRMNPRGCLSAIPFTASIWAWNFSRRFLRLPGSKNYESSQKGLTTSSILKWRTKRTLLFRLPYTYVWQESNRNFYDKPINYNSSSDNARAIEIYEETLESYVILIRYFLVLNFQPWNLPVSCVISSTLVSIFST